MIEALLVFAVFCACLGAFRRGEDGCVEFNVTALALLASTALTSALAWWGVPFSVMLWLAIDIAVIGVIGFTAFRRRRLPLTDSAVFALFAPSWYFYASPGPLGPPVSTLAVSAQLLLTIPAANVWKRIRQQRGEQPDIWGDYDLRAAHVEPGG